MFLKWPVPENTLAVQWARECWRVATMPNLNWQIELSILSAALIPKELLIEYLVLTKCVLEHVVSSVCGAVKHRYFNVIGARPAWRNVYYS